MHFRLGAPNVHYYYYHNVSLPSFFQKNLHIRGLRRSPTVLAPTWFTWRGKGGVCWCHQRGTKRTVLKGLRCSQPCVGCHFLYSCVCAVKPASVRDSQEGINWGKGVGWGRGSWEWGARLGGWLLDGCMEWKLDCVIDMQDGELFFFPLPKWCSPPPPYKNRGLMTVEDETKLGRISKNQAVFLLVKCVYVCLFFCVCGGGVFFSNLNELCITLPLWKSASSYSTIIGCPAKSFICASRKWDKSLEVSVLLITQMDLLHAIFGLGLESVFILFSSICVISESNWRNKTVHLWLWRWQFFAHLLAAGIFPHLNVILVQEGKKILQNIFSLLCCHPPVSERLWIIDAKCSLVCGCLL